MKSFLILVLSLSASLVFAKPSPELMKKVLLAQPGCRNFVRFDDNNLYMGDGTYKLNFEEPRSPIPSRVRVVPLENPQGAFELATADASLDLINVDGTLFVLTFSGIEEWNLQTRQRVAIHETYMKPGIREYKQHALAFARAGDVLVIAHGRLGVSFFNLKTRHLQNQMTLLNRQLPYESMATAVAVKGDKAYVGMDNFHMVRPGDKPMFRGVIVIDIATQKVVKELEGMEPGLTGFMENNGEIFASFGGTPMAKYSLASFKGTDMPRAVRWVSKFEPYGMPLGLATIDETSYYTCFVLFPTARGEKHKVVTAVLDRKTMGM